MKTNGEVRIVGVRNFYWKQLKELKDQLAIQLFEEGLLSTEPDELSLVNYLANETVEGRFGDDMELRVQLKEEKDGFVLIWCDKDNNPIKI